MRILELNEEAYAKGPWIESLRRAPRYAPPGLVLRSLMLISVTFVLISTSVVAQQQPANQTVSAINSSALATRTDPEDQYRIGPGDVLDIRVFNRPNLSREAVRVEGSGMIRMPLIDTEIHAACHSEGELAKEIATRYARFYKNLQVDVFVKEYHSRQVAIIGAVNEQSRFELQRRIRLLELLSYAKGLSAKAGQTINIVHSMNPSPCKQVAEPDDPTAAFSTYRLSDTLLGDPKANPYLEAGDIVTIPEANQVYVVGNVFTPLSIPLKEPLTLSRAIAMAGGVRQDTKKDKIRVVRQEPNSSTRTEIIVDLSAIEKKRAEDLPLLPNDIVDVPTSAGKSLLRGILGGGTQAITQLPIRVIP